MPRIDPVTGCSVLTFAEFVHGEAEREGKDPSEVLEEIFEPLDEDDRRIEAEWQQPAVVLEILKKQHEEAHIDWGSNKLWVEGNGEVFDDPEPAMPVEVLEILAARHHQGLRGSNGCFTAKVRCEGDTVLYAVYSTYYDSGTRLDPPEGGDEVSWYPEPVITDDEKRLLLQIETDFIHRDHWWKIKGDVGKSLEEKGLVTSSCGRMAVSPIGRIALDS